MCCDVANMRFSYFHANWTNMHDSARKEGCMWSTVKWKISSDYMICEVIYMFHLVPTKPWAQAAMPDLSVWTCVCMWSLGSKSAANKEHVNDCETLQDWVWFRLENKSLWGCLCLSGSFLFISVGFCFTHLTTCICVCVCVCVCI